MAAFDPSPFYGCAPPADTKDYIFQQTMVRVKDPEASLDFYIRKLGFQLILHRDFPQWGFTVYFIAYCLDPALIPPRDRPEEQWNFCMNTPACLELTWNHGSETEGEPGLPLYNTGNSDSTGTRDGGPVKGGFGHLGICVPDVYAACERFKELGIEFKKSPNAGGMKGLAFVKDPDGYLIEILPRGPLITKQVDCLGVQLDDTAQGYKDNSKS